MVLVEVGGFGSDGGGWYAGPDGVPRALGGWTIEDLCDAKRAVLALEATASVDPLPADCVPADSLPARSLLVSSLGPQDECADGWGTSFIALV